MSAPTGNNDDARPEHAAVQAQTLGWIERVVVGLELCPFARKPLSSGQIRVAVSDTAAPAELLAALDDEIDRLLGAAPELLETSLLVHPNCLRDFDEYNDFLDDVDALLESRALLGVLQVASFHPDYRFADAPADDPANASNRSPHPMLHLLREDSVSRAVDSHPDIEGVPRRNVERLRELGAAALAELLRG